MPVILSIAGCALPTSVAGIPAPSPPPPPVAPQIQLNITGAPSVPYITATNGNTIPISVDFLVGGQPNTLTIARDANSPFATWNPITGSTFWTLNGSGTGLTANLCVDDDCWQFVQGQHSFTAAANYSDGQSTSNVVFVDAQPPSGFTVPTVTRVGNITTVAGGGARDQGWGHHQTYHVVTSNGDEYACYPTGTSQGGPGSSRPFVIAKMAAGTGTWTTVGTVTTESDLNIFRHPPTDTVHGVFWPPNSGPSIADHPAWAGALITSGQWIYQDQAYRSGGMATDGTYVIVTQFDNNTSNSTSNMSRLWQTGTYTVVGGWVWNAKQTISMGERKVYDYILPAAYGVTTSYSDISLRDVTLSVAGLPGSGFAWDGLYDIQASYTTTAGFTQPVLYPIRTASGSGLAPAFTFVMDAMEDSLGRVWVIHYITDPNNQGAEGRILTVKNQSTILYQQLLAYQSGEWSLYEDNQGRVWALVMAVGTGGANVRVYQMNTTTFALGTFTDLTTGFVGFNIDINTGLQTLASKRAGCSRSTFMCGHFPASHTQMVGFRIDLPA